MENPFSISFGKTPIHPIMRISQTNHVLDTFSAENPSNQAYMITGVRGSGKTVMMTMVSDKFRQDKDWIVVELNPERDMLQALAGELYAIPSLHKLFIKAKLDFSALGLGLSIEGVAPVSDVEVALARMLEFIDRDGKRLLITIDEVTANEYMKVFASSFQIFIRRNYPLFLLMTGLYENIYNLQNEKSLTFLYRMPKIMMEPLNFSAMKEQYKDVFSLSDEDASNMVKLTKGYPYAYQVLGYLMWENKARNVSGIIPQLDQYLDEYVYDKIWSELSTIDRKIVYEMSESGETKVTTIRESLGMKTEEFSVYRDRLKRKGIINTDRHGYISLWLPRFEEFVKNRFEY